MLHLGVSQDLDRLVGPKFTSLLSRDTQACLDVAGIPFFFFGSISRKCGRGDANSVFPIWLVMQGGGAGTCVLVTPNTTAGKRNLVAVLPVCRVIQGRGSEA